MTKLRRAFFDLTETEVDDAEATALIRWSGFGRAADWDAILQSRLVVILSEAQSGKTYECQARQQKLWEAGEAAFYVELASVASQPWAELRSPEQSERLERWRRTETETATIFLDSVDELKLTQGRFQAALRNVANDLSGQMSRVRVVLTSRPLPVDRNLFLKTFEAADRDHSLTERDFAKLAMGEREKKAEASPPVRYVSLLPLTSRDVAQLAAGLGISDTDAFLEGLRSASMLEHMRRPQDVIEAASAWRELGGRFGTHAEQVAFDIRARLRPNASRQDRPLEDDRALLGAQRLALAVVLTRRLTIRHDVNNDNGDPSSVLDPAAILSDWRDDDRKALLERALFGFSTYGRVRFHNRLAFEFLAARRLSDLIDGGMSRKAARRLLVTQTAQGSEVIRPSLRDVVAWLALWQTWVFELVKAIDPALLMTLGDPGSLSVEQRQAVLASYVDRYGGGGWRGLSVPDIQIHRFADPSLESVIRSQFDLIENPEVRQTILDLIAHARLHSCADIAKRVLWDENADHYQRLDALDALMAIDDPELGEIVTALHDGPGPWDHRFARSVVYRLFPRKMTMAALVSILGWLKETRAAGSELSRNLPPLVASLTGDEAEELREGLVPLVEAGLHFDKSRHVAKNDRPHLIHLLGAVCSRLLELQELSAAQTRTIPLVATLARGSRSDEEVPSALAERLNSQSPLIRSAIFAEDVLLQRRLRPDREPLDLYMELIWRGALQLPPEDDAWLRGIVADQANSPDLRSAALLMQIFVMAPRGDDGTAYLGTLKPLVADDAKLAEFLENRLTPHPPTKQERRYELCSRRRKIQRERRDAKARASWVMFWRELKNDPVKAFNPENVNATAWNLWRVMKLGGAHSRSSGWDRQLIEEHLGKEIADRLRVALMAVWRRESPPLPSELPFEERNIFYERWVLALAAITAEAEDPAWAQQLTPDEVETVLRYVSLNGSDFPAWLEPLASTHASSVDRVLGGEMSWMLSLPIPQQGYSIMLQNISYAAPDVARLFLSRLRSWLAATNGLPRPGDDLEGAPKRLEQVIEILFKFGDEADRSTIASMASSALSRGASDGFAHVWLPALFEVNPELAVGHLEAICDAAGVARENEAVRWIATLFGGVHRGRGINLGAQGMTPKLLLRLLRLAYKHVQRNDDAPHEGSYSPDMRDDAETGRNMLLNAIMELGGAEGWSAKQEIANDPAFSHIRDRLHVLAMDRSAREADNLAMSPDEVVKIDRRNESGPRTPAEMFALLTDRLEDLRDDLLGDASPRELWALVSDERVMRRAIAEHLESNSRSAYSVAQETVTAEEKETDIRLRSTVNGIEGVIELKIGDKDYSGADLRRVISDQLVGKYLAPSGRRAGYLLITRAGRSRWQHPDNGHTLNFGGLIEMLRHHAKTLQSAFPDELYIDVFGLDLAPRLPTERQAKVATKEGTA